MNTQEKINALKKEIEQLEKELEQETPFNFGSEFTLDTFGYNPLYIGVSFCEADGLERFTALYVNPNWECKLEEGFEGRQRLIFKKK